MTRDPHQYAHEVRLRRNLAPLSFSCMQRADAGMVNQLSQSLHDRPAVPFEQILKSTRSK